jgi:hypothetical protein
MVCVAFLGVAFLVIGLFLLSLMSYTAWTGKPLEPSASTWGFDRGGLIVSGWGIVNGALCIATAIMMRKGRRMIALALVAVCIIVSAVAIVCDVWLK